MPKADALEKLKKLRGGMSTVADIPPVAPVPNQPTPYEGRAAEMERQAAELEAQAAQPYPEPKGTKEYLVQAARAAMENFGRLGAPGGYYGQEELRQGKFADENKQRLAKAKEFRGSAQGERESGSTAAYRASQEQLNRDQMAQSASQHSAQIDETRRLREIQERAESRLAESANRPIIGTVAPGTTQTVRDPRSGALTDQLAVPDRPDTSPTTVETREGVLQYDAATDSWKKIGGLKPQATSDPNSMLNQLRQVTLDERTGVSPGQVVNAATGRPINLTFSEANLLKDMSFLKEQNDYVKKLLSTAGATNAIKGWVTVQGMTLPVVQDNLNPDQVELGAEIQRLNNAYVYAMSGKQINENEGVRLALAAPNIRYTPEINEKMTANFGRAAASSVDGFMRVNGWTFAPGANGAAGATVPSGAQSGRREQISPSTGQYRHSLDGGATWRNGRLPPQ